MRTRIALLSLAVALLPGCQFQTIPPEADLSPPIQVVKTKPSEPPVYARELHIDSTAEPTHRSLESAFNTMLLAFNSQDPSLWSGEHAADEPRLSEESAMKELESLLPGTLREADTRIYLLETIPYKDYSIVGIEVRPEKGKAQRRHLAFKQTWQGWYLTHKLEEDPFFQELLRLDEKFNSAG